jgi:hypothetical protein
MEHEATTITENLNTQPEENHTNEFYVVSLFKLAILFSCTLGTYIVYWSYRQWKQQKAVTGEDCWPTMRGIFLIFFTHDLFGKIDKKIRLTEKAYDWNPQYTAGALVTLVLGARILDKLAIQGIGLPYTDLAGLMILPLIAGLLIYVQRKTKTS